MKLPAASGVELTPKEIRVNLEWLDLYLACIQIIHNFDKHYISRKLNQIIAL